MLCEYFGDTSKPHGREAEDASLAAEQVEQGRSCQGKLAATCQSLQEELGRAEADSTDKHAEAQCLRHERAVSTKAPPPSLPFCVPDLQPATQVHVSVNTHITRQPKTRASENCKNLHKIASGSPAEEGHDLSGSRLRKSEASANTH